jgi:hypothetical protein
VDANMNSDCRTLAFLGSRFSLARVIRSPRARGVCASGLRFARWNSVGALLMVTAGVFWWLGGEYARRFSQNRLEERLTYSPPSERMRKPSRTAENNNEAARRQLFVNLDGTAVVYPEEVDAFAAADGSFHTELPLNELASRLRIDPKSIAKLRSTNEIDPEAVLFHAVTGRLSDRSKAQSRIMRELELRGIPAASTAGCEWVTVDFPFSLNALKRPDRDQKLVLDAISRSARGLAREPGAKINAVPLPSVSEAGKPEPFAFAGGYLPLEPRSREDPLHAGVDRAPARD